MLNPSATLRLPAEWEPQAMVLLTWPHAASDWAAMLDEVEEVYLALAREIIRGQELVVICYDAAHRRHVSARLERAGVSGPRLRLVTATTNDTWIRDYGPITVLDDDRPRLVNFRFNGWGDKFAAERDDRVTRHLHELGVFGNAALSRLELVLEGGSIDSDGRGTLLTTSRCLLAPTRNPQLDRRGVEAVLQEQLGAHRVLWLEHGHLAGDDTDSHVDTLARFCDADTIAHMICDDPADEHYASLTAMAAELAALRTGDGRPYRLVPLPLPAPCHDRDGSRLPAGHANFLIINGAVLVPTYDDPTDAVALDRLAGCFPGRRVVGIPALPLIREHGSLHCITMQVPAAGSP
jgi:agmatine/peptidylarginine deiminase